MPIHSAKADRAHQLGEAKTKLEELKRKLQETEIRCAKEKADYETKDADLSKADRYMASLGSLFCHKT